MKLLVLGGTRFLGRHLVEAAQVHGHEITLFHRGRTGGDLFPGVRRVLGDRDGDLQRLRGESWDAAVDTCGYVPRLVGAAARFLAGAVGHYTFISSISVYPEHPPGLVEMDVLGEPPATEDVTAETYGPLKAACEREVRGVFGDRALILRAGLLVGPHDPTDRFTYWVRRVSMGGEIPVPSPPDRPLQILDARDLAAWILDRAERGRGGLYHATGPSTPYTMQDFLTTCREVSGGRARWIWIPESFYADLEVRFWAELPLCVPSPEHGVFAVDVSRAVANGLTFRPLAVTVRETLAWDAGRPAGTVLLAGLSAQREALVRARWRERTG